DRSAAAAITSEPTALAWIGWSRRPAGCAVSRRHRSPASSSSSSSWTHPMAEPLVTRRGTLAVPTFLPDATRAGVRGLTSEDLRGIGIEGVVVNAFHLLRRPGARVVKAAGGIHRFM